MVSSTGYHLITAGLFKADCVPGWNQLFLNGTIYFRKIADLKSDSILLILFYEVVIKVYSS